MNRTPNWQLPTGVSGGTWDYAQTEHIAKEYDEYFADYGMFRLDQQVTNQHFKPGKRVIDLGCGTGRALLPLLARGLSGVAFDLSQAMLAEVARKANEAGISPHQLQCVRGNLVDLECFAKASFDYAMCLFSTLGMVRGGKQRDETVQHIANLLKPNGLLVVQVHNYWAHLYDPDGPWWMIRNALRSWLRRDVEIGDKFFLYRGVPDMYLHSFTKRRLLKLLHANGLRPVQWIPLNAQQNGTLRLPWCLDFLRSSGWIVVAEKLPSR